MVEADIEAAIHVQIAAFADLDRREGNTPIEITETVMARSRQRHGHLIAHDPGGAFVAVDHDAVVGTALALRRGDLWGLSLLVVDPAAQSIGIGRRLLDASLRYADGCRRAVILSTTDSRAIRSYATSGFALFPQMHAGGTPDPAALPAIRRVRDSTTDDVELADRVDQVVRGAPHGPDHDVMAKLGRMFVVDDTDGSGYAYLRGDGEVYLLAATDDATATELLWRCAAHAVETGSRLSIDHLNAAQQWAFDVAFRSKLTVTPGGPVLWRGDQPPAHYLPSGAYL